VGRVAADVPEWMNDLLLPRTDDGVTVQWLIMVPLWLIVSFAARRLPREVQLLIWGLATMNLAWFLLRMAH
jgi:hypothetical protein